MILESTSLEAVWGALPALDFPWELLLDSQMGKTQFSFDENQTRTTSPIYMKSIDFCDNPSVIAISFVAKVFFLV
jgi:hypothetical protein